MILHGRFLSPFVRRVAIWMSLQGRAFEHRPLMVTGPDFETLKTINPMGRVPALTLDDGTTLVETFAIVDWLEETAAPEQRLLPPSGEARRGALQAVACANTLAEKAVALVYETVRRPEAYHWADWIARVQSQVATSLDLLEAHAPETGFGGGDQPTGATAAVVAGFDFVGHALPHLVAEGYPRLKALSERANALPAFSANKP
ncbi:MAG: glutathione S-transferase family protein [Hyphomonadaceae bacterium]